MILNGVKITSLEQLQELVSDMSVETKEHILAIYEESTQLTQTEKDRLKYSKRASVKDQIMVEMATENMDRVRKGIWNTSQLISLTQDPDLKLVQDDLNSLSFELAVMKLQTIKNPLITTDIKLGWISKVQGHFYNG